MSGKLPPVTKAQIQLNELHRKASQPATEQREQPEHLPLSDITVMADLFQPREMDEHHISLLTKVVKSQGAVEAVTVWQLGSENILIDGHHRLEAYRRAEKAETIPIRYFQGTLEEALLHSGEANSKLKLQMSPTERQNYAWRLVALGDYSKSQIAKASGISTSQVDNMRKVKLELGKAVNRFESWFQARKHAAGQSEDDFRGSDDWKEQLAERYANEFARRFGNKLSGNTEVASMALEIYFGRKLGELYQAIGGLLAGEELERIKEEAEGDAQEDAEGASQGTHRVPIH